MTRRLLRAPGDGLGRARRRRDDAGAQPEQARAPGLRLRGQAGRCVDERPPATLHAAAARGALPRLEERLQRCRASRARAGALQPAHRQLGRARARSPDIPRRSRANRPARRGIG
jgi:hypothetical protein